MANENNINININIGGQQGGQQGQQALITVLRWVGKVLIWLGETLYVALTTPAHQLTHQPAHQFSHQPTRQPTHQPTRQSTHSQKKEGPEDEQLWYE